MFFHHGRSSQFVRLLSPSFLILLDTIDRPWPERETCRLELSAGRLSQRQRPGMGR